MAVFKCKMCGGDLTIQEGSSVCTCDYCGTQQTVPNADDEKKLNLFNRATRLRMNSEFDKAAALYENLVAEYPEEAEAYWGLVICRYGIEYVDDPATGNKIPTCHRASFETVSADADFQLAMEYADITAQKVYRDEAREIDRIRQEILAVSQNEAPYDIFICYKETAENGQRTVDSVIAQDVYEALTAKGYRVFFSRISLEDKLGRQYEPYIFAALNSAKVMLAFGTKYEYYHAVWVKNEWSRFLKLMAKDKTKALIPCYKDMDAYDMPDEFHALQAQDMGKVGATQDLLRGIDKVLNKGVSAAPAAPVAAPAAPAAPSIEPLLKRAFMFLKDGEWGKANEYYEKVLDIDPECAEAYLGKVMVKLRLNDEGGFNQRSFTAQLQEESDYRKFVQFATAQRKKQIEELLQQGEKHERYESSVKQLSLAKTAEDCDRLKKVFQELGDYQKAAHYVTDCDKRRQKLLEQKKAAAQKAAKIKKALVSLACIAVVVTIVLSIVSSVLNTQKIEEMRIAREKIADKQGLIAAGNWHVVGVNPDGTVSAAGSNGVSYYDALYWEDVVEIVTGKEVLVGIKSDGSVVAVGRYYGDSSYVNTWEDIVSVSVGGYWSDSVIVGVKSDGSFVYDGDSYDYDAAGFTDLVAVSAGEQHVIGLKSDGTVVAVGENEHGQCNVSGWKDVVAVAAGTNHTVGLKKDGTVVATGITVNGRCAVSDWKNIVAISANYYHTVGLKADGTVVATGDNYDGQCNVSGWRNIESIHTCSHQTMGIKSDGSVVMVGKKVTDQYDVTKWTDVVAVNYFVDKDHSGALAGAVGLKADGTLLLKDVDLGGRRAVADWTDIVAVAAGAEHTVGLKSDGTVVATGDNYDNQCAVEGWSDIVAIAARAYHTVGVKSDGTVVATGVAVRGRCDVADWRDVVSVAAGDYHTVGLRSDGTVVATGDNNDGQCSVGEWTDIVAIAAGENYTIGLKSNGTVVATGGDYYAWNEVLEWSDIVAIAVDSSPIGLKADGTVVVDNNGHLTELDNLTDVVAIAGGARQNWSSLQVALKADGTVVSSGWENDYGIGAMSTSEWDLLE